MTRSGAFSSIHFWASPDDCASAMPRMARQRKAITPEPNRFIRSRLSPQVLALALRSSRRWAGSKNITRFSGKSTRGKLTRQSSARSADGSALLLDRATYRVRAVEFRLMALADRHVRARTELVGRLPGRGRPGGASTAIAERDCR